MSEHIAPAKVPLCVWYGAATVTISFLLSISWYTEVKRVVFFAFASLYQSRVRGSISPVISPSTQQRNVPSSEPRLNSMTSLSLDARLRRL